MADLTGFVALSEAKKHGSIKNTVASMRQDLNGEQSDV